ncbi:MAG: Maf family protein [Solirubrobacterales bacterium]
MRTPLVLASRSPQRRAILEQLDIEFEVVPSGETESRDGDPRELVVANALRKARAVAATVGDERLVLGVDTEVCLDRRVFGKPPDETEAKQCLSALSGRTHEVFSGIALIEDGHERTGSSRTAVEFRDLSDDLIEWYLDTDEWRERAGGYAIQGLGSALVERIDGDFWNVVGLPVPLLLDLEPRLLMGREANSPAGAADSPSATGA